MSEYQLINEKRFPLKIKSMNDNVDLLPYHRWEHRVTIGYKGRRFMVFLDNLGKGHGPILFIEEITSGHAERIDDDALHESLFRWATEKGYVNVLPPMFKPVGYDTKSNSSMPGRPVKA